MESVLMEEKAKVPRLHLNYYNCSFNRPSESTVSAGGSHTDWIPQLHVRRSIQRCIMGRVPVDGETGSQFLCLV